MIRKIMASVGRLGRGAVVVAALTALTAGTAFGGVITVSKNKNANADAGMFTSIQKAVNAAKTGDIVRIIDAEVYEEQVTIDGRDPSPWNGKNQPGKDGTKEVIGGKHGITIEYRPSSSLRLFGNHARPTIKFKDVVNHSPKTTAEGNVDGDTVGSSGNFETCGALRIIRAQGVVIDGIKIDGDGAAPFGTDGVWGTTMFHGNAAIAIVVAGGAVIRNCDLGNAYYGIAIKDRNTGGVFGNPNPGDNDLTIPLSGFGKVGNHLIEYNKIHGNMTGIFTESAWDLATTIRYNLIYSNIHKESLLTGIPGKSIAEGGAILFRDVLFTPFAIYNNTFFNNTRNLMGGWKAGVPHLVFNNIFSRPDDIKNGKANTMTIEDKLPYRMHNCVFAATNTLQYEAANVNECKRDQVMKPDGSGVLVEGVFGQKIMGYTQIQVPPLPQPSPKSMQINCLDPIADMVVTTNSFIPPGVLITGQGGFEEAANLRWLETAKSVAGTEDLFVSTDSSSADFLKPKWDHPNVIKFIKAQGWTEIGMKNSDGTIADLGAVPYTGRAPATVARIKPSNVVLISGSPAVQADANYFLSVESGTLNSAKISFLRWVAPLPNADKTAIPKKNINNITPSTTNVKIGNNSQRFSIPEELPGIQASDSLGQYGFFEVAVSGKDGNGNDVTSDIGFLPYRKLSYTLKIEVFKPGSTTPTTVVDAGEPYTVKVTPYEGTGASKPFTTGGLSEISFDLLSDATAFMYQDPKPDNPLTYDKNLPVGGKSYDNVYFIRAGAETIMGSALYEKDKDTRLVFLGTADITVRPGDPDHVTFIEPIPVSQLGGALPPVINRGVDKEVRVEVQDKYGNAVSKEVTVTVSVDNPSIGDVAVKTATTKDGVATFIARTVTNETSKTFDITATISGKTQTDNENVGRLRIGRSLDRIDVLYDDAELAGSKVIRDDTYEIKGNVNDWFKITVVVAISDSVNTAQTSPKAVRVIPDNDALIFSATSGGTPSTTGEFPLSSGVATFWVSSNKAVNDAWIDVEALESLGGAVDLGIASSGRGKITFEKQDSKIIHAIVYGDGQGRPDSVLIQFATGGATLAVGGKPDSVTLAWGGVVLSANGTMLINKDDYTLKVDLTGVASRPRGYTSVSRGIISVFGAQYLPGGDNGFDVIDGIGPVIAVGDDDAKGGNPVLTENKNPGTDPDDILIRVSEQLRSPDVLIGKTLYYAKGPTAPPNDPASGTGDGELTITDAFVDGTNAYRVTVSPIDGGLQPGDWIRFNPSGTVVDRAKVDGVIDDNKPHAGNRWAKLRVQEVAPSVRSAWYTSNSATGQVDYAYVVFDKTVDLESWFSDGKVTFGKDVSQVATVGLDKLFSASKDTLKIDLSVAYNSGRVDGKGKPIIRTSGDMPFTLDYATSKKAEWEGVTSTGQQNATDWAKPVLADTVFLVIGDVTADGSTVDTLKVTYSERPSDAALRIDRPVSIIFGNGGKCEPALEYLSGAGASGGSGFYNVTYKIVGNLADQCDLYPKTGDMVRIDAAVGFEDGMSPQNVQDVPDNLKQPLKVIRELKWTVKVKNNPFGRGMPGRDAMAVTISPNVPPGVEANEVKLDAVILVFDNLGALVVNTTLTDKEKEIVWNWDGTNQKGRMVGTGTYLFKALCKGRIAGAGGTEPITAPPPFTKTIGVVRGKD